ncbi:hypothetical protein FACS1894167_12110 [Synergistales bacterium]|nr:hypothetical protein FACS1894167_12110 [Synergistales bacterium]
MSEVMTQDKVFTEVMKAENDYWGNSRNRYIQYLEEKHERDALSVITSAERRGEAKGEAKGLAKGKAEIAKNLLSLGVDYETIAKATGLSVAEIESLRDK